MNIHDFRRIARSLEGAEESSHMGSLDFRRVPHPQVFGGWVL